VATAFRHADGTPEPLCAIWEPAVRARIEHAARAGRVSLRRILETEASRLLAPDDPERLSSVNSADDDMRVRAVLARQ
jgi:molybdopterin-guanine dinucleotide biosynthesis protein A